MAQKVTKIEMAFMIPEPCCDTQLVRFPAKMRDSGVNVLLCDTDCTRYQFDNT